MFGPPRRPRYLFHDTDSDPEEEDVEEHFMNDPGPFLNSRPAFRPPYPQDAGHETRAIPDNPEQIIRRFTEMMDGIGGRTTFGRSGPETLFGGPHRVQFHTLSNIGSNGGTGVRSFTFTTGSGRSPSGLGAGTEGEDPFQSTLRDFLGGVNPTPADPDTRQPPDFSRMLGHLMMTMFDPHTMHGDAVYSQEALDRIITNLMEANPQSNAPAPASEEAIATLPKKKLNEQMLGSELKGECTICIDDMAVGDEVVVLPCRHWFHEECVVLWLKQHNTCPICRAPIDGEAAGHPGGAAEAMQPESASAPSSSRAQARVRPRAERRGADQTGFSSRHPEYQQRPPSPPGYYGAPAQPPRPQSPPNRHRSGHGDRTRNNRGSSAGPLRWFMGQFGGGDRRT
ncbi:hypothetical protein GGS23DRAFT_281224 [Durotheca rogersii]|uniref:uncharacterized protein n=1 Tax=Durotheca rogersii TaxID=419775 RepID=UPI00221FD043|nr:uncharacterized protein GGS23DRAFT_281224 [Durotheca rogersii]KAI5866652.1 hypothetical protein GGS23DRAFT_281224 [Durotheca rogersii]